MKKALSIILVIGIIFSCMAVTAGAEGEVSLTPEQVALTKLVKADTDGNGTCNTADVQKILRTAIGIESDSEVTDIDSSGYTSTQDALILLKHLSGVEPLVTDAELLDIVNAKLNAVKTEKPGFTGVSTAQCTSMKVTQKFNAVGTSAMDKLLVGMLNTELAKMSYTDLEYDKYVAKMVEQLESSKNADGVTEADKAEIDKEIAAMRKSAATYKDAEIAEKTVAELNANGHRNYFPRSGESTVSSALTLSDIDKVTYSISNGKITLNVLMKNNTYTNATYPKTSAGLADIPYGKAFNVPFLRGETGSTLTTAEYKNGKISVTLDKDTTEMTKAVYTYNYFSDIKAATKKMDYTETLYVSVDMATKMYVTVNETFTF